MLILVASFLFVLALGLMSPQPADWKKTFIREDTVPYGTAVLFSILQDMFPGQEVTVSEKPPFLMVRDSIPTPSTYLFITTLFAPDENELHDLLDYARAGNILFVAAEEWGEAIRDSLGIEGSYTIGGETWTDSIWTYFVNPQLASDSGYVFPATMDNYYFSNLDTLQAIVLGIDGQERVNYVMIPMGEGKIYFSSLPKAFTNYHMLYQHHAEYATRALSYLPDQHLVWDAYYKPGRTDVQTPLRYILNTQFLGVGYYLLIAGILMYILLQGKRRQRPHSCLDSTYQCFS